MKYTDLLKKLNLLKGVFDSIIDYSAKLDKYFEIEENVTNHKELYDYYINLTFELDKLKKRPK